MATYTLFGQPASPSGSAGGAGATTSSYGLQFSVSSASRADGVWFYSLAGSPGPLPDSIALYDTSGNLVTLAAPSWSGAAGSGWVFAAFPAPPSLVPGATYKAVFHQGFISPNWNKTDSTYWSSGAGASGITSGILSAPNNATAVNGQGSTVTGSAIAYPTTSLAGANVWMDIQVSTLPANTYTVFQQQPVTVAATGDNSTYTMGMQFAVNQTFNANAVWFYSPAGSPELPETIGIYHVPSQALVHSETPTWSAASGSGWTRAAFSSPPALNASDAYKVVILKTGTSNFWYAAYTHYWDTTGPGASGLTNGPLSAPNNASATNGQAGGGGQDIFNVGGTLGYPNSAFNAGNYWVDVEIVPTGSTNISVSDFAGMVESRAVTATVPVSDFAGVVESINVGNFVAIFVSDFAGQVESTPHPTVTVPVADFAGMVERMTGTVSLSVTDFAGALDNFFNAGIQGSNLNRPAIVFVAATYKGNS